MLARLGFSFYNHLSNFRYHFCNMIFLLLQNRPQCQELPRCCRWICLQSSELLSSEKSKKLLMARSGKDGRTSDLKINFGKFRSLNFAMTLYNSGILCLLSFQDSLLVLFHADLKKRRLFTLSLSLLADNCAFSHFGLGS